jgi:heme/copper-type cytochrome/quinol oxidase subunit 1
MTRAILQELVLFLLPFVAFALYLVVRRRNPLLWSSWSAQSVWLVIAGLICVVISLLAAGFLAERQTGTYVPSHMENGRIVPGQFK